MKRERTEAIILHTLPVRERDKLVVFLTPEHGKKKGWAYGARSLKNRYGASLELLSRVRIGYVERETEEVVRIESVDLKRSLFDVRGDLATSISASYIAETVDTFAQPDDPSEQLFRLLDRASAALLAQYDPAAVVTYLEVWVLKLAGVFPSLRRCLECHNPLTRPLRYDAGRNGFLCGSCARNTAEVIPNEAVAALELLLRSPVDEFAASRPSRDLLFEIRSLARNVRRSFLGHELKSHDLLAGLL